jgi:hypothetical protein
LLDGFFETRYATPEAARLSHPGLEQQGLNEFVMRKGGGLGVIAIDHVGSLWRSMEAPQRNEGFLFSVEDLR